MVPQEGVGGCTPSPRKERPASRTIVSPIPSVAATITGAIVFGMRWRTTRRARERPRARPACMNSRSLRLSTSPRTSRVGCGHCVRPSTATIRKIEGSKNAMIVMRSTSRGKEITMSTNRITTESNLPPTKPETAPSSVPIVIEMLTATNPIVSEMRAP